MTLPAWELSCSHPEVLGQFKLGATLQQRDPANIYLIHTIMLMLHIIICTCKIVSLSPSLHNLLFGVVPPPLASFALCARTGGTTSKCNAYEDRLIQLILGYFTVFGLIVLTS